MPSKRNFNSAEAGMNSRLDPKSERIPDSMISRSPEQALQAEIELLAANIGELKDIMREKVLADIAIARNENSFYDKQEVAATRAKLSKSFGIPSHWPAAFLAILESRIKEGRLNLAKDRAFIPPKNEGFEALFKNDKVN